MPQPAMHHIEFPLTISATKFLVEPIPQGDNRHIKMTIPPTARNRLDGSSNYPSFPRLKFAKKVVQIQTKIAKMTAVNNVQIIINKSAKIRSQTSHGASGPWLTVFRQHRSYSGRYSRAKRSSLGTGQRMKIAPLALISMEYHQSPRHTAALGPTAPCYENTISRLSPTQVIYFSFPVE